MAMMTGLGPFGHAPAGSFNQRLPRVGLLYLEPSPRRIRGLLGDEVVVDSTRVSLLLEHGRLPRYYFPEADVRHGLLVANGRVTRTKLKGETRHLDVRLGDRVVADGAFTHPAPPPEAPPALPGALRPRDSPRALRRLDPPHAPRGAAPAHLALARPGAPPRVPR